jgi:hypothetical protein
LLLFVDEECYFYLSRLAALRAAAAFMNPIPLSKTGSGHPPARFTPTKAFTYSSALAKTSVADLSLCRTTMPLMQSAVRRHDKMRLKSAIRFVHRVPLADKCCSSSTPRPPTSVNSRVPAFPGEMHKNAIWYKKHVILNELRPSVRNRLNFFSQIRP